MLETISTLLVTLVEVYALVGVLVLLPFMLRGAGALDPAAKSGSVGFRILIVPGTLALWPVLLVRWWNAARSDR